ncbi:MAG: cellulase family glycosylhydrolase [Ignavibacteriae bacterium]|nr:cellulase family glycosylhydrolase [Ignavibacteriota bacterium]
MSSDRILRSPRTAAILCLLLLLPGTFAIGRDTTVIVVHADRVRTPVTYGIGASWHAVSEDSIDMDTSYTWALRTINARGSAWGGNPPLADTAAWRQLAWHARWLGFTFLRVELEARMYEPARNIFDWNNEEMGALYRILDHAEASGVNVFLQQMWSNVGWNAYPGVQPLLSAPRSVDDFAEGLAALMEHLTRVKGYTCIRWLCITNEPPGGSWGSWWMTGDSAAPYTPALRAVRRALDARGLSVALSGPDWTDLPLFDSTKIDFDPYISAYDIHSYQGIDSAKQQRLGAWVRWARAHEKPMFLSEIGDMSLGWRDTNAGPKTFAAALSNAESILRGLDAGVSAFNRWSFTNRGDLDGQWQLVRTWDIQQKRYLDGVRIEPAAYYGYGIITRFWIPGASVLVTDAVADTLILAQALRGAEGEITIYIVNKGRSASAVTVMVSGGGSSDRTLYRYVAAEETVDRPDYRMDPSLVIQKRGEPIRVVLPARSITTLSSLKMPHEAPARR